MQICLTKNWVKEKSIAEGRRFSDLLYEIMLEDLLERVVLKEKPVSFVFRDDRLLTEPLMEKNDRVLSLSCDGDLYLAKEELVERLAQAEGEISWEVIDQNYEAAQGLVRLMLEGSLEEMRVPFVLEIKAVRDQTGHISVKSFTGPVKKKPLEYRVCTSEQKLSECLFEILDRLELIGSMSFYDEAYEILKKEAVDGRLIAETLKKDLKGRKGSPLVSKLKGYRDYYYMEKRWISYQKNKSLMQKKKYEQEWKELLDLVVYFLVPIVSSLDEDRVFVGDWMPELGRFI